MSRVTGFQSVLFEYILILPLHFSYSSSPAVVTIQITDVNDVVPEFVQSIYSRLDLTEDVEIGTRVINVQARDMDLLAAGMVRYSIIAGKIRRENQKAYFGV